MIPAPSRASKIQKKLAMTNPYTSETGCCPRFVPEPWNETELQWNDKLFVRDRVPCLFYMPLNFGKVMTRVMARIAQAVAFTPPRQSCCRTTPRAGTWICTSR